MMEKHTRGPWTVQSGYPGSPMIWVDTDAGSICSMYSAEELRAAPFANAGANARLIAAAPDLLEACKKARKYFADRNLGENAERLKIYLNEVISKAESVV